MEIERQIRNGLTVLALRGKLDTLSAPTVEEAVSGALKETDKGIVIDMSDVRYVSSAGMRIMLVSGKTAKAEDKIFRLAGLNETVGDVFRMSGFDRLLEIHPALGEALG